MHAELNLYGVYVPTLLVLAVTALVLQFGLRRLLALANAYTFVWHRGLFDIALYVVLLGLLSALHARLL
ncbi:DUF1656 domain-containing protein [Actomonas aquatica]|uniref:DUF1656 domain-containing protein n=1 Tax=Actomonas aquatica TaxID=2866162 RepID=A0ABZ1C4Q8_9BACT|nr:DUF1656 domain-containing protein [Opitutus sp. WL0086]WRQ86620.1 DUF1656 domain-containing protein [Opitutus sp. WL0086]